MYILGVSLIVFAGICGVLGLFASSPVLGVEPSDDDFKASLYLILVCVICMLAGLYLVSPLFMLL